MNRSGSFKLSDKSRSDYDEMWQEKQNTQEWMLCFYPDWRLFLQQKTHNKHLSKTWLLEDLVAFRIRVCESNYLKTEFGVKKKITASLIGVD